MKRLFWVALASLTLLGADMPHTESGWLTRYVGIECNRLGDTPTPYLSSIGFQMRKQPDGSDAELTLQCTRHFYRAHWEPYDPFASPSP